jgi:hypothetical protein
VIVYLTSPDPIDDAGINLRLEFVFAAIGQEISSGKNYCKSKAFKGMIGLT